MSVCSCVTATAHAQLGSIYIHIIIVEQVPHKTPDGRINIDTEGTEGMTLGC